MIGVSDIVLCILYLSNYHFKFGRITIQCVLAIICSKATLKEVKDPDPEEIKTETPERKDVIYRGEKRDSKKKKKPWELPWWGVIVAWVLLWLAVLASAAFVTFYGVMFGDLKCKKWITSLMISTFLSILVTQPIKVKNTHKHMYLYI